MNLTRPQKHIAAGKPLEALAMLPGACQSTDPRVEILRARALADTGNLTEAINTLENARGRYPTHTPHLLFQGIYYWDAGQVEKAGSTFAAVLEAQPGNDLARSYLALTRFAAGDYTRAAETWKRHGFSDNVLFRVRCAEHIEKQWLYDRSFMGETAASDPSPADRPSARRAMKKFYKRDFSGMLQHLPAPPANDELAAFLAATAHEMLRQYSAAEAYLRPLDSRRAEWPDPLVALNARLLTRTGKLREAASEFSKVLIVGPEDFGVNYYLAVICLAYEKPAEARQYFLRAFTSYMVDTLEFQWWQLEQVLLHGGGSPDTAEPPRSLHP